MERTQEMAAQTAPKQSGGVAPRKIVLGVVLVALAVAAYLTVSTLRRFDHYYGPVVSGNFYRVYPTNLILGNGLTSPARMVSTAGATAKLMDSLDNRGSHSVMVTGVDTSDVIASVRWSEYKVVPGGYATGVDTPWRPFPALLPAGGTIRILVTIHRPAYCADRSMQPGAGEFYAGSYIAHWQSLLHDHTLRVDKLFSVMIQVC